MELKDFTDELLQKFNINKPEEFRQILTEAIQNQTLPEICETYDTIPKTEGVDYIQKMYQFFLANREEKNQDFTPPSLAKLCAKLTNNQGETLDLCGGVGRLTIDHYKTNKGKHYHIHELDENVIPYLIFNLAYNNISATVYKSNVLTGEITSEYNIQTGKKYGNINKKKQALLIQDKPNNVISNPPFNVNQKEQVQIGNTEYKGLMNYAFIQRALIESSTSAKIVFILPNGVLSSTQEEKYRKQLVDDGFLRAVIICPNGMFESTSIPVCVLYFDKNKSEKITFIDAREKYDVMIRKQKGEGSASHRNRTYKKNMATFTDKHITEIQSAIINEEEIAGFSKTVTIPEVQENEYILGSNRYVDSVYKEEKTRPYEDIIKDINRIRTEKNKLKLTCNKVWLKELSLHEVVIAHNDGNDNTESTNSFLRFMKLPELEKEDWIASSNSKVLKWENKDKDKLSTVLLNIIPMWKQHIHYLNDEENRLLTELRDKLLPQLMSGEIDVSDWDDEQ